MGPYCLHATADIFDALNPQRLRVLGSERCLLVLPGGAGLLMGYFTDPWTIMYVSTFEYADLKYLHMVLMERDMLFWKVEQNLNKFTPV